MQYAMQVFEDADHDMFRVIDRNGEPWFVLSEVCKKLGIGNTSDAARRLDDDEKMTIDSIDGHSGQRGGAQKLFIINESGLYSLILTSRKDEAKKFKKWVTAEVLPTIRKTGAYHGRVPAFLKRYAENFDRVEAGHFSVISELVVRIWGRLELAGYKMADRAADGKELRPDVSVGKGFAEYLRQKYPSISTSFGYYMHKSPEAEFEARQYPNAIVHVFWEYVDNVWIPECAEEYFRKRDPAALPYLPKLLPPPAKPKAGMMKRPTTFHRQRAG